MATFNMVYQPTRQERIMIQENPNGGAIRLVTRLVDVVWLGHACFMLKGTVSNVMFDPFKGVGLREPRAKADIILCSHSHSS